MPSSSAVSQSDLIPPNHSLTLAEKDFPSPMLPQTSVRKTLMLNQDNPEVFRAELKDYFNSTFSTYESLFKLIHSAESYYLRPEPLRHPLIFYFGHTATFFINKLILARLIEKRINPSFESMFAVGVDEMSWDDLDDTHYDWPSLSAVTEYRQLVRQQVNTVIDDIPIKLPINQQDPAWVILMGIEHERIHLETSSVIIRMLPLEQVHPSKDWAPCPHSGEGVLTNPLQPIGAQQITLGKPETEQTYGWDNEYGATNFKVSGFEASQKLISNAEFLAFVQAGGYQNHDYWSEEGKAWLNYTQAKHPRFWLKRSAKYWQRNLTEEIELPLDWPVEVNYLEAKAYCCWFSEKTGQSIRLPTEAEWMILRNYIPGDHTTWNHSPGNVNLEFFASSCPVHWFKFNIDDSAFYDIIGNVWQWTETAIDGFEGFQVHPLYDDFSTPTFDGKHNLIKGGSWISTGNEAIKHSRYAFRRHFFQHAGFRIVHSEAIQLPTNPVNSYETDELVSQYLEFHYGPSYFSVPNFPLACVKAAIKLIPENLRLRALDIGCAVGRGSFELAQYFEHVDGIDFSARFIQSGVSLQERGAIRYTIPTEGKLVEYREESLTKHNLADHASRVQFTQGDATNLKPQFKDYDLVMACNLIDRLNDPRKFLELISQRIRPGGWLVLSSPYTWLEDFTEKENWLGGYKKDGESVTTLNHLKELLQERFHFESSEQIPFVIRETARKFQHTLSEISFWQRRP